MGKHSSAKLFPLVVNGNIRRSNVVYDESVPPNMTIGDLKKSVFEKLRISLGFSRPVADPELFVLVVLGTDGFPLSDITKDDAQSLGCYLSDSGYFSSSNGKRFPINLEILEGYTWKGAAKLYALAKKSRERERDEDIDQYYSDFDDSDNSDSFIEEERFERVVDRKSPLGTLEEDRGVLRVVGRLHVETQVDNCTTKCRAVPFLGGLGCDLKDIVKMTISAACVFLVSTTFNLGMLGEYYARLDLDPFNDPDKKILVLFVTSDKFSYLFLKMLRKNIGTDVPIVAVTESIILELELLAFLDTPSSEVDLIYNCDLSQVCADLDLTNVVVDIKWAGIRPSELLDKGFEESVHVLQIGSPVYDLLCEFLERHPKLVGNQKWLQELEHFRNKRVYRDIVFSHFHDRHFTFWKYFMETYFPHKLDNEDWI